MRVKPMELQKSLQNPENEFYLSKFAGKIGQLFDITRSDRGVVSFHVNFGKDIGIFYETEIELVTE